MKILLVVVAIALLLTIAAEILLRWLFGFGNPPLYVADPDVGYLLAPNQRVRRFGNTIATNAYSMRGDAIAPKPAPGTLRVFLLGDSIANGGWWTPQDEILSALMARSLSTPERPAEVLNASANSWGPRNEAAYLQKFGLLEARALVVLLNTDDLFAITPHSLQVGKSLNYMDRKPPLAIAEVLQRYVLPTPAIPGLEAANREGGDRVGFNLEAIAQIQNLARERQTQFLLAMTPLLREIGEPGPRDYEVKTRKRLDEFVRDRNITFIDFLPIFNGENEPAALYRDRIHLSARGNRLVCDRSVRALQAMMDAETYPQTSN